MDSEGGYAMELRFQTARATRDLDFTVRTARSSSGDGLVKQLQVSPNDTRVSSRANFLRREPSERGNCVADPELVGKGLTLPKSPARPKPRMKRESPPGTLTR